jgi:hypothetical protein
VTQEALRAPTPSPSGEDAGGAGGRGGGGRGWRVAWMPSWPLVTTKFLELRKRTGLMVVAVLLVVGFPVLVLGLRLVFHAVDPHHYGPAGTPAVFELVANVMAEFSFVIAATVGAAAGTTDLADGVFRHLVVTGRSRVALYLARLPAGLAIVLPLVAVAFALLCLVTSFAGTPEPPTLNMNGVDVPLHLDQSQLERVLLDHPLDAVGGFGIGNGSVGVTITGSGIHPVSPGTNAKAEQGARKLVRRHIRQLYAAYTLAETTQLNPTASEMTKVGLWLALDAAIGFVVALGLGSLLGQRTVATILMIVLEIVVTPILAGTVIPYFLNGQRLVVGVAMDQLRPVLLTNASGGRILGGRGLGIPPMPTWAMVAVIVAWLVVSTAVGAWRMATRDA